MRKNHSSDGYDIGYAKPPKIGYAKPPKANRFQKGTSGNPTGRSRKILNFDDGFIKEASSMMIVNENGKRKRMTKHQVAIKQLMKREITGSARDIQIYLGHCLRALETQTVATDRVEDLMTRDVKTLTHEELVRIILTGESNEKLHELCRDIISEAGEK